MGTLPTTRVHIGEQGALAQLRLQSDGHDNAYAGGQIFLSNSTTLGNINSVPNAEGSITYINDGFATNHMRLGVNFMDTAIYIRATGPGASRRGRIGIATSTPASTLSIASSNNTNTVDANLSVGTTYALIAAPNNGAIIEGSVGIGTSNPAQSLHVNNGFARIEGATSGRYIELQPTTVQTIYATNDLYIAPAGAWVLKSGGGNDFGQVRNSANTEYVRFDGTNQRVGIGTSAPAQSLHINNGFARIEGTTSGRYIELQPTTVQTIYATNDLYIAPAGGWVLKSGGGNDLGQVRNNAGNTFMLFDGANQRVGIGTAAPSEKLEVCGNLKVIGTINASSTINASQAITCSSDKRYKTNINSLTHSLSKVLTMQGVTYQWRVNEFPDKQFKEGEQIGFIAQEIEKIYPELVFTDKDGYKSVDYSRLTPILVEAIKEQQKLIENLQIKNQSYESKFTNSELKIQKLETAIEALINTSVKDQAKK